MPIAPVIIRDENNNRHPLVRSPNDVLEPKPRVGDDPCTCCGVITCPLCNKPTVIAIVTGIADAANQWCNTCSSLNGAFVLPAHATQSCFWILQDTVTIVCFGSDTLFTRAISYRIETVSPGVYRGIGSYRISSPSNQPVSLFSGHGANSPSPCPPLALQGFGSTLYCTAADGVMSVVP